MTHMRLADAPEYMTAKEVAEILRVTPTTIGRWRADGTLRGKRVGKRRTLYARDDVIALLPQSQAS